MKVTCNKAEDISVTRYKQTIPTIPSVIIAALNIQVSYDSTLHNNEIVNIGILLHHKFPLDKMPSKPLFDQRFSR